jgi:autotransporter-associated beta strand protein
MACAWLSAACGEAEAQRVLGLDVSRHQGQISQSNWNTAFSDAGGNRKFVFVRSTRGGTTGEDHRQGGYPSGNNTFFDLSQRYDDPYFVQFITGATTAGMLAGPYHFGRADILSNTGTDEANHFIQMAGAWMRPGYLLPTYDFEQVNGTRSDNALAQFSLDFSNRIFEVMGIRPSIYTNGDHANNVLSQATNPTPAQIVAAFPNLWSARWPAGSGVPYPDANVQTEHPKDTYTQIYGPWDDPPNPTHPWVFWQYSSGNTITGIPDPNVDADVAQGDIEFVKDRLIPAMWWKDSDGVYRDGEWTDLAKWNSGQTPVAPADSGVVYCGACTGTATGQLTPTSTTLPIPRVAGAPGLGSTTGLNDTVILNVPSANITVTHSSGTHNVRKLFVSETLNITGGSLTVNYDPLYNFNVGNANALRSGPLSGQFSAAVSLSGSGSFEVHTLQVDSTRTFTLGGGTLTFNTINLMPHATTPAKISVTGDVAINPLDNGNPRNNLTAIIANGSGGGSTGYIDLTGGTRALNIGNGDADVDVQVNVPVTNGGLTKAGAGTLLLNGANTFSGPVAVQAGTLRLGHASGLGNTSLVTVNNGARLEMPGVVSDTIAGLMNDTGHSTGVVEQGATSLTVSSAGGTSTYAGTISGTGSFTKSGAGTQVLEGNNSLGAVNVNGGTLLMNGINTTGTVTVSGGTFGGTGSVSGTVVANATAHIAPGASPGVLTTGGLTLNAGSVLDFELGSTFSSDLINVTGTLIMNGGSVNITNFGGGLDFGTYTLIDYGTSFGDVADLGTPTGPAGFAFELVDTGSQINLLVNVPAIEGDHNEDGVVDAADYVAWRKLPENFGGDPGGYDTFYQNFGSDGSSGGSQGSVPEPGAAAVLLLGAIGIGIRRRCPM